MFGNLDAGGAVHKYATIKQVAGEYTISELCKLFRVSRSGYYAYLKRQVTDRNKPVKDFIQAVYRKYDGKYGYRQTQLFLLQDCGVWVNHKKVLRLMQEMGLRSRIRRKYRSHYVSSVGRRVAENALQRDFKACAPNQKWVTDITQYRVADTWLYLSAIKDLFNNEIVAYHMGVRNDNELVLRTFEKAFEKTKDVTGLIVHSDQGFQYTSYAYHDMLPKVGAQISMSRRGNCYDNASMESFFSHLKTEGLYPYDIRSVDEAQRRIEEYIQFYNQSRPQRRLKKLTPVEFRRQLSA
ncbi:IS3 family transposase [Brevibacillus choshinensis]|uniref:IS3 family transposase n=1 Tax=Brevibacillus choshinensis TaxID=54911 RepID=A0ABX7FQZ4_BRECH|nr:IS3 family transposase [Brevibacillus choshinensis]QRG67583.1 IS3 family transposase [Brevibacillus choshinensis]QRG67731.1 IS3 family transposase [Brevibacillus choshinensis]QRG68007.1 IS3 family transposase [Brevibacillus choshinensis]QRG68375.1 IS3 family transposase [Brevibacillus choshinensis]QRG69986.1 IS3 family transposase [Brevibacillus choshinensis]